MIYVVHQKRSVLRLQNVQYVGRPTVLGNPFTHLKTNTKALFIVPTVQDAVAQYQKWLHREIFRGSDSEVFKALLHLTDLYLRHKCLYLSCWCKDELDPRKWDHDCHADILRQEIYKLSHTIEYYNTLSFIRNPY